MTAPFDLLLRDALLPDGRRVDLGCRGGLIAAVAAAGSLGAAYARATRELGGRLVTPGLVDAHVHLDKAFLSARAPSREGTLTEAIRVTGEAKKRFTVEDIRARARQVLDLAVRSGTTVLCFGGCVTASAPRAEGATTVRVRGRSSPIEGRLTRRNSGRP